jgi:hypothetical protein
MAVGFDLEPIEASAMYCNYNDIEHAFGGYSLQTVHASSVREVTAIKSYTSTKGQTENLWYDKIRRPNLSTIAEHYDIP